MVLYLESILKAVSFMMIKLKPRINLFSQKLHHCVGKIENCLYVLRTAKLLPLTKEFQLFQFEWFHTLEMFKIHKHISQNISQSRDKTPKVMAPDAVFQS